MEPMNLHKNNKSYTLKFLQTEDDADFSKLMTSYIREAYADLLDSEDLQLLDKGELGLDQISRKYMAKYRASKNN